MHLSTAAAIAASTLLTLGSTAVSAQAAPTGAAADRAGYIVVLEDGAAPAAVAKEHSRAHDATVSKVFRSALKGYAATMTAAEAAEVGADPDVLFVQRDGVVHASAQSLPTGINRANADASPTARINGADERVDVDVAVIDTGVNLTHPDLNVHTSGAKNCSTGRSAEDGNGHGTHVAGTIGALDNATGVVGVAPGARIWPVRVLNSQGSGTFSAIICGIDYVTAHADQIEVANMSLGGAGTDDGNCGRTNNDAMHIALCSSVAAGVTYVVAAGNSSANAATAVPAAYDEVITVSALADFNGLAGGGAAATCRADVDDTFADFSNFGADVDLIAPGVCIASTWKSGGYNTISGTSMASPHVAGGAALYKVTNPGATPAQVRTALVNAGTLDWSSADDRDTTKERLLDVSTF